jgi:hypothetical protein
MNKYIIERTIPGAGKLSAADLCDVAAKSNGVLREMGGEVQWVQSYVTGDKIYCVYNAKTADLVREHARRGGFPADTVALVSAVIDPTNEQAR